MHWSLRAMKSRLNPAVSSRSTDLRKSPVTPLSLSQAARPTSTLAPSMVAPTPRPAVSLKPVASANGTPASSASWTIAFAVGWLEKRSALAARRSSSAGAMSPSGLRRLTTSLPVVSVPVLSKTKAVMRAAASRSEMFFTRIPRRAAALSAATIAVGVARMNAHGQAPMSTLMTRSRSFVNAQTNAEITRTSGV